MGNCTHKPPKPQRQRQALKVNTQKEEPKGIKSDSQIFEDMTPEIRLHSQGVGAAAAQPKQSLFKSKNIKESEEEPPAYNINAPGSNLTNQTKSTDFQLEKTTSSRQNIKENYRFLKTLGEGSFGKVRLAQNINGKKFAIKSILKADAEERFYLLRRELDIMKKVDHPNLVKFYETYHDDKHLHIVMEYVEGAELSAFCEERFGANRRFTEIEVAYIIRKLLSALSHMHSLGIFHRDIKPENIMINEGNLDIKILDFGLSRDFGSKTSQLQSIVGTPLYVAPEVINETGYNEKCDVWSVGVLMYYLLSGSQAFEAENIKDLFKKICQGSFQFQGTIWNDISDEAKVLITKLLTVDPQERISCEKALQNSWFSSLQKRQITHKSRNMKKCLSKIQNVICFQNSHRFKQEIIRIMFNTQTQSDEIEKLKQAFETIDIHDNGYISAEEMFKATQLLKIQITLEQIKLIFLDINGNRINNAFRNSDELDLNTADEPKYSNLIHYSDFIYAAINLSKQLDQTKIKQLFAYFDKDNDNFISSSDIENTLAQEGRKLTEIAIKQMIEEVDNDGDGKISYQEFTSLIQTEIEVFQKTRTSFTNLEI